MGDAVTNLYFIRHAQADGLWPRIVGSATPNAGLSALGIAQAERLRKRLATSTDIHADVLVSSPLHRARETAEIIAPGLGLPVLMDDELQELNLGACEGLTVAQIGERFGHTDEDKEPFRRFTPDADSWAEFIMRACRALDRLTRDYAGRSVAVVSHGRVVEATFRYFLSLPLLRQLPANLMYLHNTSITEWGTTDWRGVGAEWTLLRYNDHRHLDGLDEHASALPGQRPPGG